MATSWGSSPQLVGLLRHSEEVPGAGVGAFHGGLLAPAGDRTRWKRVVVIHRVGGRQSAWTVAHNRQLAPHENDGAGGVGPALRGRPRWHPALVNDVALHEILTQPEFVCWRVV